MNAHHLLATTALQHAPLHVFVAREPTAPWAARALDEDVPPASLGDARARRDELRGLLSRERAACADFLLALADFDRRRGWERLGHASLFAFLTRELRLSKGAAFLRLSAARLLPRHPAVEAALRRGDLCLSAVGELARVLTPENEADVLPRYFGCSSREAREVSAALLPALAPPAREVVTRLTRDLVTRPAVAAGPVAQAPLELAPAPAAPGEVQAGAAAPVEVTGSAGRTLASDDAATPARVGGPVAGSPRLATEAVRAHEPHPGPPALAPPRTPTVEPLTADLRRLHLTVSKEFLDKVAVARTGLSHALPGATTEQVLERALDLLLARQAQRKGLGRRARRAAPEDRHLGAPSNPEGDGALAGSGPMAGAAPGAPEASPVDKARGAATTPQPPRRPHVPAAVEREVRLRDGDRCQHPLDAGGVCGATWQVELDHVVPVALGGPTTASNLRCACRFHNRAAAEEALGPALVQACRPGRG